MTSNAPQHEQWAIMARILDRLDLDIVLLDFLDEAARIEREKDGRALTEQEAKIVTAAAVFREFLARRQPANLGDCVSCDGYVLDASEAPHCPTCARLLREGKPL